MRKYKYASKTPTDWRSVCVKVGTVGVPLIPVAPQIAGALHVPVVPVYVILIGLPAIGALVGSIANWYTRRQRFAEKAF
jgi:hypothetical protein